jgi:uncharacterized Tic20 family protein
MYADVKYFNMVEEINETLKKPLITTDNVGLIVGGENPKSIPDRRYSVESLHPRHIHFNLIICFTIFSGFLSMYNSMDNSGDWVSPAATVFIYFFYMQFSLINKSSVKSLITVIVSSILVAIGDAIVITEFGLIYIPFIVIDLLFPIILIIIHLANYHNGHKLRFPIRESSIYVYWIDCVAWTIPYILLFGKKRVKMSCIFAILAFLKLILQKYNLYLKNRIIGAIFIALVISESYTVWQFIENITNETSYSLSYYLGSITTQSLFLIFNLSLFLRSNDYLIRFDTRSLKEMDDDHKQRGLLLHV